MDDFTYDDDGNPVFKTRKKYSPASSHSASIGNMTAIFDIEGNSFDVVLDERKISWTPVSGNGKGEKTFLESLFIWLLLLLLLLSKDGGLLRVLNGLFGCSKSFHSVKLLLLREILTDLESLSFNSEWYMTCISVWYTVFSCGI